MTPGSLVNVMTYDVGNVGTGSTSPKSRFLQFLYISAQIKVVIPPSVSFLPPTNSL